ncbi:MAG: hypothetical protein VCB78_03350 [Myxococcota bacterium]
MQRSSLVGVIFSLVAILSTAVQAQEGGGCVFNRTIHPEGFTVCRDGELQRCEEGNWADIGLCDDASPAPPPRAEGGDVPIGDEAAPQSEAR